MRILTKSVGGLNTSEGLNEEGPKGLAARTAGALRSKRLKLCGNRHLSSQILSRPLTRVRQELSWKAIGLAGWAKKRAAFALETANHPSAAVGTGLAFFAIDEMAALVSAFRAIRCIEILDA